MHTPLTLAQDSIGIIAVGGGFVVAIVAIVCGAIRQAIQTKQREQSRREIAAYIAEGSMSPDEGERLMNAGKKSQDC